MSNYYLGTSPEEALGDSPRYWYALRRNDDGELFFFRSDQLKDKDSIELNLPGDPSENFEDFEPGIDYLDGIAADHEVEYENLVWVQYRWDNRNMLYYIGQEEGRLVQRINQGYTYPEGNSSNG
jgi:hypothetical protein